MSWAQLVIATNATYIAHLSQSVDDDLRNTDNAWIESMILSYHDSSNGAFSDVKLRAGPGASSSQWVQIHRGLELHASHLQFLTMVWVGISQHAQFLPVIGCEKT